MADKTKAVEEWKPAGTLYLTLLAKQLYRLSTVEQYIVKLAIRYYVFSSCKCM